MFRLAAVLMTWAAVPAHAACTFTGGGAAAFCDTFDQGPSPVRGRAGDLDPVKWSVGRMWPNQHTANGLLTPVPLAPIPPCRASLPVTEVFPPDDTLICDPSGTRTAQLMTAVILQNYGNHSFMIRPLFDFTGRTGKIVFDVDAVVSPLDGFITIEITEDPVPAPTYREWNNNEPGPLARNGLMLKFANRCGSRDVAPGNVMVYNNYVGTIIPVDNFSCGVVQEGALNHFEIRVSQTRVEIWGSDFSPDNGQTYPNFHKLSETDINLNFTRGYVHFGVRNHATDKYSGRPDWIFHWDNIGFDGPVFPVRGYEVPDNTTKTTVNGQLLQNLAYRLLDGTSGVPAGVYNPTTRVDPFQLQGVNLNGAASAKLTLNAYGGGTTWGLRYRFNGGVWRDRTLTAGEIVGLNDPASVGNVAMMIDVPLSDLRTGTNALEIVPLTNGGGEISNIDLLIYPNGTAPPTTSSACDLNSDTLTNVNDVQLCANQAIGFAPCTSGDINHDTQCNVVDVQRVVNEALGGQCVTQ